ncbi:MAG: di-heme oxidoredictase family protein [Verrucomicrobiota bacterium]
MSRLLLPLAVLAGFLPITVSHGMDPAALSGGSTTVFSAGQNAYALPLANLSREKRRAHVVGNSFFNKNWVISPASTTARDGLGPLFHARSCSGCHVRDGRGRPPELGETPTHLLFRLSIPGKGPHGEPIPDPSLGGQVGVFGIPHMEPEAEIDISFQTIQGTFADGSSYELLKPIYSQSLDSYL